MRCQFDRFSYTPFTIGKAYRRSQYVSAALLMPSPAKPMACSMAFFNAHTKRQSKQSHKSHSRQPSNNTRVIFSKSFTQITTLIGYLRHRWNTEQQPNHSEADNGRLWLVRLIGSANRRRRRCPRDYELAVFGRCIRWTMPRRVPGAWNVLFCFPYN